MFNTEWLGKQSKWLALGALTIKFGPVGILWYFLWLYGVMVPIGTFAEQIGMIRCWRCKKVIKLADDVCPHCGADTS